MRIAFLSFLLSFSLLTFAQETTDISISLDEGPLYDALIIKGNDLYSNKKLELYVNEERVDGDFSTDSLGRVNEVVVMTSVPYIKGYNKAYVILKNYFGSDKDGVSRTYTFWYDEENGSSDDPTPVVPAPTPSPKPNPTNPTDPNNDEKEAEEYLAKNLEFILEDASYQAENLAIAIANTYGIKVNFLKNFREGFIKAYNFHSNVNNNEKAYKRALKEGGSYGKSLNSYQNGKEVALSTGSSKGYSEAQNIFINHVEKGSDLDYRLPSISVPSDDQIRGSLSIPSGELKKFDLKKEMKAYEQKLLKSIRSYTGDYWGRESYKIPYSWDWDLWYIYNYNGKYELIYDWNRESYAWDEFYNNPKNLYGVSSNLYRKILNDAPNEIAKKKVTSKYKQYFQKKYSKEIDEEYGAILNQRNAAVVDLGQEFGKDIGEQSLHVIGFNEGLLNEYARGYVQGYSSYYRKGFETGFNSAVDKYTTNAVLDFSKVSLTVITAGIPGGSVSYKISGVRNYGAYEGKVSLTSVKGQYLSSQINENKSVVEGYSVQKDAWNFENISKISNGIISDKSYDITISFKELDQNQSFKVNGQLNLSFLNVVKFFAEVETNSPNYSKVRDYFYREIYRELDEALKNKERVYLDSKSVSSSTKLRQLVSYTGNNDRLIQRFSEIASEELCDRASGHKFLTSYQRYKIGKTFKELYRKFDQSCR